MTLRGRDGRSVPLTRLRGPALLALALAAGCASLSAQDGTVGYWDTPAKKQAAMLARIPADDASRLTLLRHYFSDAGCIGDSLLEQPAPGASRPNGDPPHHANLLCTLPGRYSISIVVAARYPASGAAGQNWAAAVALPMLYHALAAQQRHFTFIFAEICDQASERLFLDSIRNRKRMSPYALIAVDALGRGSPRFFTASRHGVAWHNRSVREEMEAEAWRIAKIQGFAIEQQAADAAPSADAAVFPSTLLEEAHGIPRILLYSALSSAVAPDAFHRDLDFAAFYISAIDLQLDPLEHMPE